MPTPATAFREPGATIRFGRVLVALMVAPGRSSASRQVVGNPRQGASALPLEVAVELESVYTTASKPKAVIPVVPLRALLMLVRYNPELTQYLVSVPKSGYTR